VNLTHRGAVGADPTMGDGAGIMIQMPHKFLTSVAADMNITLPAEGDYGVAVCFLPQNAEARTQCEQALEKFVKAEGQIVLGWRENPVSSAMLSDTVRATEPAMRHLFVARGKNCPDNDSFERKLFVIRKQAENAVSKMGPECGAFYVASFSSRVMVYKGMLLARDVGPYYRDLADERLESCMALVHQRFSTNTFPRWRLAHPYRMVPCSRASLATTCRSCGR
jgi:glutamate synthase (NADPH/NADH) large chain